MTAVMYITQQSLVTCYLSMYTMKIYIFPVILEIVTVILLAELN
jgi:hypothetical protein